MINKKKGKRTFLVIVWSFTIVKSNAHKKGAALERYERCICQQQQQLRKIKRVNNKLGVLTVCTGDREVAGGYL